MSRSRDPRQDPGREAPGGPDEFAGLAEEPSGRRNGCLTTLLLLLLTVLVLAGVYLGGAWFLRDRPPAGLRVHGVDVGTLSEDAARAKLERQLGRLTTDPVKVTVQPVGPDGRPQGESDQLLVVPERAGMSVDVPATLAGTSGFTLDPRELWTRLAGEDRELPLVTHVDQQALTAEITRLAKDYDTKPVEGDVRITDTGVQVTDSQAGRALDVAATAQAVRQAWPDARTATGKATAVAPQLSAAEVTRFTQDVLEPAIAEPVTVVARDGSRRHRATLAKHVLVGVLEVDRRPDHTLALKVDDTQVLAAVRRQLGPAERGPRDATVRLSGTGVKVVPGRAGLVLPEQPVVDGVRRALRQSGAKERTVQVALQREEPTIPTATAQAWRFTTMSEFESVFPGGEANAQRTQNLHAGIAHVNGTVVMPGQQFSLAQTLSPVTEEEGYAKAPIIMDGRLELGLGGGLSQVSTTVFNASWFAGVQLDAHTPHSFYIPRYPVGREATIAIPVIDNLWTNDTDSPIVIRSWIEGTTIHMIFLGDRQYEVKTVEGPRVDVKKPKHVVDDSPKCVQQFPSEGFTITVTRQLLRGGKVVHEDPFTTTYIPEDEVTCTNPKATTY